MKNICYTVLDTFSCDDGDKWDKYIEWSKISHVSEIISLDTMLCPSIIEDYTENDWKYQSEETDIHGLFTSFDYVIQCAKDAKHFQILAVLKEPNSENWKTKLPIDFIFKGYDLIDDETMISALTNCGGFPESFSNSDLNRNGLIQELNNAIDIRNRLKINNPDEAHADCSIYGIARLDNFNKTTKNEKSQ